MKRSLLLFFLLVQLSAPAQETFVKISQNYFRSAPFGREFSKFLHHLMNDPTLTDKTISKKNDSTLFFFQGTYNSFNPFFFKTSKTKVILAEKEEVLSDSLRLIQTIYVYQLLGYAPPGEAGMSDVKEEFEKFCRRYKKGFGGSEYEELKQNEKQSGEIKDFSLVGLNFYPLTVAWATTKDHHDNVFAITIRFKVKNNVPYLPIFPNGF